MNQYPVGGCEPDLAVACTIDVRRADNGLDDAAAWIANLVRHPPGSLIDLTNYGPDGNVIHIRTESPPEGATDDLDSITT